MRRLIRALDPVRDLTREAARDPAADPGATPPDYRFSLANERTFLAWLRTGLALVAGGLAAAQFLPRLPIARLREAIAIGLLLLGAAVAVRAVVHWARCERAMWRGEPLPPSTFPTVLALSVAGFGLLLTGVVAYQAVR